MANPEHLKILEQGVDAWNAWRKANFHIVPNLNYHQFLDARGNSTANLSGINFDDCCLVDANLAGANLRDAKFSGSDLRICNLNYADLSGADLSMSNMTLTRLEKAILRNSNMYRTNLCTAYLDGADLTGANFNLTILSGLNFIGVIGLSDIEHSGPSYMDIKTILYNEDHLPEVFLKGIGIPDAIIQHLKPLIKEAIEFYSCFISYSSKDKKFADRLHKDLQNKGVSCWFASEDMKIGDEIRQKIDQSIRSHEKLLLILSENSISSEWCEDECESAYEEERRRDRTVLFPVRIDDAVMDTDKAWAAKLRRSRNIGDFTKWKDHDEYQKTFEKLMKDLKAENNKTKG